MHPRILAGPAPPLAIDPPGGVGVEGTGQRASIGCFGDTRLLSGLAASAGVGILLQNS